MSTLALRNEQGWCDCCKESIDECYCYHLISWEGELITEELELLELEKLLNWAVNLAYQGSPPRFDGPVLNKLPIQVAKELAALSLNFSLMDTFGYESGEDMFMDLGVEGEATRTTVYVELIKVASEEFNERTIRTDGFTGGIYDIIEVENPDETRRRMEALLAPAIEAIEAIQSSIVSDDA